MNNQEYEIGVEENRKERRNEIISYTSKIPFRERPV
jgi:hypothetical protein